MKSSFMLSASGGFYCACEIFGISRNAHARFNLFHSFAPHERGILNTICAIAERQNGD